MSEPSKLYIVATPIGNLGDISRRAAETLELVDFVAAEDTRVTAGLLNHLGIKKPLVSCYRHNENDRADHIIDRILAGENCALCCDAGTPAVSDPGEELVRRAAARGVVVEPIPGPCAAIAALCASGIATGRFCFEGFLPMSKKNRRERLSEIRDERRTLVFYEAPHKLRNTLNDLLDTLGDREITLARELTKIHEEIDRTTLFEAVAQYKEREPRGEYALVVAGAAKAESAPCDCDPVRALALISELRAQGVSLPDACKETSVRTGIKKGELYRLALSEVENEK
ncbi:MAG: 16S rRNA (cytidine(1402)-2'-O)-methyltransferase [Oscillospiraceae bacterium]